jgi:type IV pilus assembly protein PilE
MQMQSKKGFFIQGFTLIELMIVVAIVGVLASLAYPAYTGQLARGKRADARVQLATAQQWIEKFYSENYNYATDTAGNAATTAFNAQPFSTSPRAGDGAAVYTISLTVAATSQSYTVTAVPLSGGSMAADSCGSLSLTNTGRRGNTGTNSVLSCWK